MPRTTTLELPGCPPLRALTFDALGLIKVIESRGDRGGQPQLVERWGTPDASKYVLAASIDDREKDPLLAVSRKCGEVEVINPLNGEASVTVDCGRDGGVDKNEDNNAMGLHLFRRHRSSGSFKLLTCSAKGDAALRSINIKDLAGDNEVIGPSGMWKVCASGHIECCKVDSSENYAIFGGKRIEVNLWDFETLTKIWTAKPPPKNGLGIFNPTWFTSATFLTNDDHRKFAAGTNNHQVRLYDMSAQRRPIMQFDFRETPIKAVTQDQDERTIYIGNGSGDLASVDIRTGKLLGCFLGKCSGSIRSIAGHQELPIIASCGLDNYLRLWDKSTRQPLSAIYLKQHLTNVLFDSNFIDKGVADDAQTTSNNDQSKEVETLPIKRKKEPKDKDGKKKKSKAASGIGSESKAKKKNQRTEDEL